MLASDASFEMWILGLSLVLLAGLNAPLAGLALTLVVGSSRLVVHAELQWLSTPAMSWVWSSLVIVEFLIDLYFVPATIRDRAYLHERRFVNAHLNTRFQSLMRPLIGALALASLPLQFQPQAAAVIGFVLASATYWTTAWVREHVAISRGSVILLLMEMSKNIVGLVVVVLAGVMPILAFGLLFGWLAPVVMWTTRLQREQSRYTPLGGQVVPDDS